MERALSGCPTRSTRHGCRQHLLHRHCHRLGITQTLRRACTWVAEEETIPVSAEWAQGGRPLGHVWGGAGGTTVNKRNDIMLRHTPVV